MDPRQLKVGDIFTAKDRFYSYPVYNQVLSIDEKFITTELVDRLERGGKIVYIIIAGHGARIPWVIKPNEYPYSWDDCKFHAHIPELLKTRYLKLEG